MKKFFFIFLLLLFIPNPSSAEDIKIYQTITQTEFDRFIEEFGTGIAFNPMAPAEPLGITGFDVGVEIVATDINETESYWRKLVEDSDPDSYLIVPRLHVQKGLPFDIDIGAIYVETPDSNVTLWGLEAKYALLSGTVATPAVSIRGSYSKLDGVDEISLNTQTIDLLVSKGILMFTPYGGVSAIRIEGKENSELVALNKVEQTSFRGLIGLQFSPFPLFNFNAEVTLGDVTQYGLKMGLRF
ncbi:MAG: hypothetical protein JW932_04730 [Deltaproteobacteria bacterium]|nr:hypothetical protein [Deltaproteobacteria bacterium]